MTGPGSQPAPGPIPPSATDPERARAEGELAAFAEAFSEACRQKDVAKSLLLFAPGADLDPKIDDPSNSSHERDSAYIVRYFAGAYSTILDGANCRVLLTRINLMRPDTAAIDGQIIITSAANGSEVRHPWIAFVSRHRGRWLIDSGYLPTRGVVLPPRSTQRLRGVSQT